MNIYSAIQRRQQDLIKDLDVQHENRLKENARR